MAHIEDKVESRRLKHGLIMNEVVQETKLKNQIWEDKTSKMKEEV